MNRLGSRAGGPGEGRRRLAPSLLLLLAGLFLAVGAIAWKSGAASAGEAEPRRRTPSGLPVPRWVSLKFDEVNARAGPGDDYRLLWTYRVRGLPLQVIAETTAWRRVCDPEGAVAWVHQRTVDTRRTVMRTDPADLALRRRPAVDSPTVAVLRGRSIAPVDSCREGWCRVAAGGDKGWAPAAQVWGTAGSPQCRPRPGAPTP